MTTDIDTRAAQILSQRSPDDAGTCASILHNWTDAAPWLPRCHAPKEVGQYDYGNVVRRDHATPVVVSGSSSGAALLSDKGLIIALHPAKDSPSRGVAGYGTMQPRQRDLQIHHSRPEWRTRPPNNFMHGKGFAMPIGQTAKTRAACTTSCLGGP